MWVGRVFFFAEILWFSSTVAADPPACVAPIEINGLPRSYLGGGGGSTKGDALTIEHGAGFSLFSLCDQDWKPDALTQLKLLGKTFSFVVDLSRVGCACNLAFYLISMPARDKDGNPSRGEGIQGQPPYYCDANKVGGQWCPEIDLLEANSYAMQATAHSCDLPQKRHYESCDRAGCGMNTRKIKGAYGPGKAFQIDTTKPFQVATTFLHEGLLFTGFKTVLSQQGKNVVLQHLKCSAESLKRLSAALADGMSLRITYWGGAASDMAWLDSPPCGWDADCDTSHAGLAIFSNMTIFDDPSSDTSNSSSNFSMAGQDRLKEVPLRRGRWKSDSSQPWQCHHYVGNQQQSHWCKTVGFESGYEFRYTNGESDLCGSCWCCRRKATKDKLGETTPANSANEHFPEASNLGRILIGGQPETYIVGTGVRVDGPQLVVRQNAGVTVFSKKEQRWNSNSIQEFKLLDKVLVFTVDLSKVGCACNLAVYLVGMPARGFDGFPNMGKHRQGQPPFYCDANKVGGQWCPEIDIMEANNHVFQATLHRCDPAVNGHYDSCDRGGCAETTKNDVGKYGIGSQFTIDTTYPFNVETEFVTNDGVLSGMRTVLSQNGLRHEMLHEDCSKAYLAKLTAILEQGMSLRITYWGGEPQTMAWLDVPPCGGEWCAGGNAGDAVVSDIRVLPGSVGDLHLVWVISDPEDDMYGQIIPKEIEVDEDKFVIIGGGAVAEIAGSKRVATRMSRGNITTALSGMVRIQEKHYLNAIAAKYSDFSPAQASTSPPTIWLFVGVSVAASVVGGIAFFTRKLRRLVRPGSPAEFARRQMHGMLTPDRRHHYSVPMSPSHGVRQYQEGPSPMRRPRSTLYTPSPGRQHDVASLMDSCIE